VSVGGRHAAALAAGVESVEVLLVQAVGGDAQGFAVTYKVETFKVRSALIFLHNTRVPLRSNPNCYHLVRSDIAYPALLTIFEIGFQIENAQHFGKSEHKLLRAALISEFSEHGNHPDLLIAGTSG